MPAYKNAYTVTRKRKRSAGPASAAKRAAVVLLPKKTIRRAAASVVTYGGVRGNSMFPKNKVVTMKLVIPFTWNDESMSIPCNALYNPLGTSSSYRPDIGTSPLGYNEYSQWYNHYIVKSSTCRFTCVPANTACSTTVISGIVDDTAGYATGPYAMSSQVGSKTKWLPGPTESQGASPLPFSMTLKFDAKKFFQIKDLKDNVQRLGANFGNNPTEMAFFVFNRYDPLYDTTSGATPRPWGSNDNLICMFEVNYQVEFSEPNDITTSKPT